LPRKPYEPEFFPAQA